MRNIAIILICLPIIMMAGCTTKTIETSLLTIAPSKVELPAAGGHASVAVATNAEDWTYVVEDAAAWCSVSKTGNSALYIEAGENTELESRSFRIRIEAGICADSIEVIQYGAEPVLSADKYDIVLDENGSAEEIRITTNLAGIEVLPEDDWCEVVTDGSILTVTASPHVGKDRNTSITVTASSGDLRKDITVSVTQKGGEPVYEVEIPDDFSVSCIYSVMAEDVKIAEICREYIRTGDVDRQMTVMYPVSADGKADLSSGRDMDTFGYISWDMEQNTCTYVPGEQTSVVSKVWIDKDNGFVCEDPGNGSVAAGVVADLLVDVRGASTESYRIVKIGTQYWMADNLRTEYYRDGSSISEDWSGGSGAYIYLYNDRAQNREVLGALYNGYAVTSDAGLAPEGWSVPSNAEWEKLLEYVGKPYGTKLRSQSYWELNPGSGITGFDARPGQSYSIATDFLDTTVEAWFWSSDTVHDMLSDEESMYYLRMVDSNTGAVFNTDDLFGSFHSLEFGHSVRCVRK